jgi:3-oxoacyl-[acyl-carrier protein] reductase
MLAAQRGSIVNLSSMWGQVGASCEAAYSATKGAVDALTKALAKELGPSGIRVNAVSPGLIDTEMNAHLSAEELAALTEEIPLGRIGKPDQVARAVEFLAFADYITGQILPVNGGMVI